VSEVIASRIVTRFRTGHGVITEPDAIATEYALTLFVNDQEMATIVCTPEYMEELVVGFLASEGAIRSADQITSLSVNYKLGRAYVETSADIRFDQDFYNKRYIGSCCGKSRQSFYFRNDAQTVEPVMHEPVLDSQHILDLMESMENESALFKATGGVHMACLCDTAGGVVLARTDIGRHNALDKLFGHVLQHEIDLSDKVITFSGRLSSEVLLKIAKIGVGLVLAKSAPTVLALDMAEELNITTVGFIRGDSFNLYTHPRRIRFESPGD
jgi:FdhD protein